MEINGKNSCCMNCIHLKENIEFESREVNYQCKKGKFNSIQSEEEYNFLFENHKCEMHENNYAEK